MKSAIEAARNEYSVSITQKEGEVSVNLVSDSSPPRNTLIQIEGG